MGGNAPVPTRCGRAGQVEHVEGEAVLDCGREAARQGVLCGGRERGGDQEQDDAGKREIARSFVAIRSGARKRKRAGCGPAGAGPSLPAARAAPSCFGPSPGCVWPQQRLGHGVWGREQNRTEQNGTAPPLSGCESVCSGTSASSTSPTRCGATRSRARRRSTRLCRSRCRPTQANAASHPEPCTTPPSSQNARARIPAAPARFEASCDRPLDPVHPLANSRWRDLPARVRAVRDARPAARAASDAPSVPRTGGQCGHPERHPPRPRPSSERVRARDVSRGDGP